MAEEAQTTHDRLRCHGADMQSCAAEDLNRLRVQVHYDGEG